MPEMLMFIIFLILLCIIPGYGLTKNLKFHYSSKERFVLSSVTGLVFYTLISVIFYFLRLKNFILPTFLFFDILLLYFLKKEIIIAAKTFKFIFNKQNFFLLLIIVTGTLVFINPLSKSIINITSGLTLSSGVTHDSLWHLAIQQEINKNFPPEHPGFSGTLLKNYHYFSDIFQASFANTSNIPALNLFFLYLPTFLSILYGLAIYLLIKNLTQNLILSQFSVIFAYFSSCLSYLLPLINPANKVWGQGTFMLDQPLLLLNNLHSFFAITIVLSSLLLIYSTSSSKWAFLGILVGFSAGFKVYPALSLVFGFGITAILDFLKDRKIRLFIPLTISCLIIGIISILTIETKESFLIFLPGWLLKRMVEDPDRVYWPNLYLTEQVYREHNNILRLWQINIIEILIYLLGNLGIGILGLIYGIKNILKRENILIMLLTFAGIISIIIPLLFNQKNSVYDIIQFGTFGIVIFLILTPLLFQNTKLYLKVIIFSLLFISSIPVTFKAVSPYFFIKNEVLSPDKLQLINYLKTHNSGVILIYPLEEARENSLFSALSGIRVYYADQKAASITGKDVEKREIELQDFFADSNENIQKQTDFIKKNNITKLYLSSQENDKIRSIKIPYKLIYKNKIGSLYNF